MYSQCQYTPPSTYYTFQRSSSQIPPLPSSNHSPPYYKPPPLEQPPLYDYHPPPYFQPPPLEPPPPCLNSYPPSFYHVDPNLKSHYPLSHIHQYPIKNLPQPFLNFPNTTHQNTLTENHLHTTTLIHPQFTHLHHANPQPNSYSPEQTINFLQTYTSYSNVSLNQPVSWLSQIATSTNPDSISPTSPPAPSTSIVGVDTITAPRDEPAQIFGIQPVVNSSPQFHQLTPTITSRESTIGHGSLQSQIANPNLDSEEHTRPFSGEGALWGSGIRYNVFQSGGIEDSGKNETILLNAVQLSDDMPVSVGEAVHERLWVDEQVNDIRLVVADSDDSYSSDGGEYEYEQANVNEEDLDEYEVKFRIERLNLDATPMQGNFLFRIQSYAQLKCREEIVGGRNGMAHVLGVNTGNFSYEVFHVLAELVKQGFWPLSPIGEARFALSFIFGDVVLQSYDFKDDLLILIGAEQFSGWPLKRLLIALKINVVQNVLLLDVGGSRVTGMNTKCGLFEGEQRKSDEIPWRDVTYWNIVISGYYQRVLHARLMFTIASVDWEREQMHSTSLCNIHVQHVHTKEPVAAQLLAIKVDNFGMVNGTRRVWFPFVDYATFRFWAGFIFEKGDEFVFGANHRSLKLCSTVPSEGFGSKVSNEVPKSACLGMFNISSSTKC